MRRTSLVINQRAVLVNVEPEEKRIGPRKSLHEQAGDERLIDAAAIGLRARAVDHAMTRQRLLGSAFPIPVMDLGMVVGPPNIG
jgi:hypothetical protein